MKSYCRCNHESQDKLYGKGMRVFNKLGKPKPSIGNYTCTVCGSIKNINDSSTEKVLVKK